MAISKGRHGALDGAKIHVFDSGKKGCAFRQELEPRSAFSSSSRLGQEWRFRRDAIEQWMAEKTIFSSQIRKVTHLARNGTPVSESERQAP